MDAEDLKRLHELMEELTETAGYDDGESDWEDSDAGGEDVDEDDDSMATDEAAGHAFRGNKYTGGIGGGGKAPGHGKGGVSSFCYAKIAEGKMSYAQIAEACKKEFGGNTSKESVAWYASQAKKMSPEGKAAAAAKAEGQAKNNASITAIKSAIKSNFEEMSKPGGAFEKAEKAYVPKFGTGLTTEEAKEKWKEDYKTGQISLKEFNAGMAGLGEKPGPTGSFSTATGNNPYTPVVSTSQMNKAFKEAKVGHSYMEAGAKMAEKFGPAVAEKFAAQHFSGNVLKGAFLKGVASTKATGPTSPGFQPAKIPLMSPTEKAAIEHHQEWAKANPSVSDKVNDAHSDMMIALAKQADAKDELSGASKGSASNLKEAEAMQKANTGAQVAIQKFKDTMHAEGSHAYGDVKNASAAVIASKSTAAAKEGNQAKTMQVAIVHEGVPLTHGELEAIHGYTDGAYDGLNDNLRTGTILSSSRATLCANLDSALAKGSLDGGIYYRGIDASDVGKMFGPEINKGDTVKDMGFVSTSHSKSVAEGFSHGGVVLQIEAPKGAKGMDVTHISSVGTHEKEVILPRGSKFEIISVKTPTANHAAMYVSVRLVEDKK